MPMSGVLVAVEFFLLCSQVIEIIDAILSTPHVAPDRAPRDPTEILCGQQDPKSPDHLGSKASKSGVMSPPPRFTAPLGR